MSNDQYKSITLRGLDPIVPSLGGLAPLTVLRWPPMRNVMRAQDAILATTCRILAQWSGSGSDDWSVPAGTVDPSGGGQSYPDDEWRVLGTYTSRLTPGAVLKAYCEACPSGLVEKNVASVWDSDGAWGEVRVGVTFSNGATSVGPLYASLAIEGAGGGNYGGLEPTEPGQAWQETRVRPIGTIRPTGFVSSPSTRVTYSEWTDVEITIEVRGGARLEHVVVHEFARAHTTAHDNDGLTSANAMLDTPHALTRGPMTKAVDGATYEEHRFGTRRAMQVAERQSERLGPRVMHWSSWDETASSSWNLAEGAPVAITSTSFVHLLDGTITSYSSNVPGWIVGSAYAQLFRLCDPDCIARGRFAGVPVRVTVDAARSAGDGVVRVQSGTYDWVDVPITGARNEYTLVGYLEGQAAGDHTAPPLVVWGRVASGTLSVYNVSVDFGWW